MESVDLAPRIVSSISHRADVSFASSMNRVAMLLDLLDSSFLDSYFLEGFTCLSSLVEPVL